jgi:hypothetical protein
MLRTAFRYQHQFSQKKEVCLGRTNLREVWRRYVFELLAEGRTRKQVKAFIDKEAASSGRPPLSESGVHRLAQEYAERQTDDRYRELDAPFRWPDAMLEGVLPWEAGKVGIDLVGHCVATGRRRPTNRMVQWCWRILQARPDASIERAEVLSALFSTWEWFRERSLTIDPSLGEWILNAEWPPFGRPFGVAGSLAFSEISDEGFFDWYGVPCPPTGETDTLMVRQIVAGTYHESERHIKGFGWNDD